MNKQTKLLNFCNKYGDFKICNTYKLEGDIKFSKHYSVLEIWSDIEKLGWRLDKATDRTLFCNEVVLDVDKDDNMTIKDVKLKTYNICNNLYQNNILFKCYSTGGNGYHIHFFINELAMMKPTQRANFRRKIIQYFKCDNMKASDNMMILMEGEPNRKTGNIKKVVKWQTLNQ